MWIEVVNQKGQIIKHQVEFWGDKVRVIVDVPKSHSESMKEYWKEKKDNTVNNPKIHKEET